MPVAEIIPYLLLIAVVSLLVAPVMWMRPSPRQRRLAALRQRALQLGLRPELRERPAELPGVSQRQLMRYSLRAPEQRGSPRPRQCWFRHDGGWSGTSPAPGLLRELPADVLMVELAGPLAGAYWLEGGTTEDVAAIHAVLASLLAGMTAPGLGKQDAEVA